MAEKITPGTVLRSAFPGIPVEEAAEMIAVGKVRSYPDGTVLCHEGATENIFYIILEGEVKVTKYFSDAEARLLKRLKAGDFFGEMALIQNAPRAATVTSVGPLSVLEIRKDDFERLLRHSTSLSLAMARNVSGRLRENDSMAIDDLRLKARELAEAYQRLAEEEYARHEFLTAIAHELRTPLTAASGFLQLIRSGVVKGDMLTEALDTVAKNVEQIVTLTNDLLFLQEMDLILPDFESTDVGAVVTAAIASLTAQTEQSGVVFRCRAAPGLPPVLADSKSLQRAIGAILDNAVKFSPEGGVVQVDIGADDAHLWIMVKDHGVGIPPDILPRIFERFFHTDQVGKHLFRGVGLGLSIAKQVIEQHGGEISVASEPGKGSTFKIYLNLDGRVG
jgi:hypothetical protein